MTRLRRAAIVAGYTLVFWGLVPLALWTIAGATDRALRWNASPVPGGAVLLAGGLGLAAWGMVELWRHGRGLPVSALPPPRLTARGPYRYVRHPIYLGFNVAIFGAGLVLGSPALAWLVAPAFAPMWIGYATLEERGLVRRFGPHYRRYRGHVGVLPRLRLYPVAQVAQALGALPVKASGGEHVPRRGPAVLVWNHACYLDPVFVGVTTRRQVHFLTTAEVFRGGPLAWAVKRFVNVPVRRYRPDPAACREMVRLLAEGELIGIAPEGERSVLGDYQGAHPDVASILARLPVPVVPIGVTGNYDCGPRWADVLRRRSVSVRVGPPVEWDAGTPPEETLDAAIRSLLAADPQPVHLDRLPRERLGRVLWRCPDCGDEPGWHAAELECAGCGARYRGTADGRLTDAGGTPRTLAGLGHAVRGAQETGPLVAPVVASRERSMFGPIRALEVAGSGQLVVVPERLSLDGLCIPLPEVRSTSTERGDTLQIAAREEMWQFRFRAGSPFRVQLAMDRWRGAGASVAGRRPPRHVGALLREAAR